MRRKIIALIAISLSISALLGAFAYNEIAAPKEANGKNLIMTYYIEQPTLCPDYFGTHTETIVDFKLETDSNSPVEWSYTNWKAQSQCYFAVRANYTNSRSDNGFMWWIGENGTSYNYLDFSWGKYSNIPNPDATKFANCTIKRGEPILLKITFSGNSGSQLINSNGDVFDGTGDSSSYTKQPILPDDCDLVILSAIGSLTFIEENPIDYLPATLIKSSQPLG